MTQRFDNITADAYLGSYFNTLKATGYVKHSIVTRFLVYTFLIDFVDVMKDYITEEDYAMIGALLNRLFTSGNCLLPYEVFCNNKLQIAKPIKNRAYPVDVINHFIAE